MMKSVVPENTCRFCLRVNTKLFRLSDIHKDFIEYALHKEIQHIPQEDFNACNICLYLVSKLFDFIQRICNTQKIIKELLYDNNCDKLTVSILENINRDEMGFNKFCTATITIIDINGSCNNGYFWKKTEGESNDKSEESNKYEVNVDIKQENETQNNSEIINSFTEININQDENIEGQDGDKYLSDDCEATDPMEIFTEPYNPSPTFNLENLSETMKHKEIIITSNKISHPGPRACKTPPRPIRPFPTMAINTRDSEEETVKDVEGKLIYPVVDKKKGLKQTKMKMKKGSAPFVPTAMNMGPEETIKNVEEFNYAVVTKKKILEQTKIKRHKDRAPFIATAMNTEPIRLRPRRKYCFESESSSDSSKTQNNRFRTKVDTDYCPDSTSHSEDSVYDSYDDEGKRIRRPKDNRVYPMKCDHCDYDIPKKAEHYLHYLFEHPNVEYPYLREKAACSICGKLYPMGTIKLHESKHTKMKVKCTECPRVFENHKNMSQHRYRQHRSNKSFTCDYCSKTLHDRHDLIRHLRIHTGEKPFKCHICDAAFAHSGNRTLHIRSTHQNINIVPKKRKGNKKNRKHKKNHYSNTESELSENEIGHTRRKRTKKRNNKENHSKIKTVNNRNLHQDKKNNDNGIESIGNNDKQTRKRKRKKDKKKLRANKSDKVCSNESEEVDTDSDEETLADKKAKTAILDREVLI